MEIAKEIIDAVLVVRKGITSISKDAKNPHGGYNYVPIDTYYEKISSVATAAGLAWRTREISFDLIPNQGKNKDRTYVQSKFAYDLMAKDKVAGDYMSVTILSPIDGPQTTGQLFSYADKVFMRVAFCVATGEADADDIKQEPISLTAHTKADLDDFLTPPTPKQAASAEPLKVDDDLSLDDPEHDPETGEILPEGLHKDHMEVVSKIKDDLPLIDTRKVAPEAIETIEAIFTTFMPKIKSPGALRDWHAENLAAIEKVKTHDPAAHDRIKTAFNTYNKKLKEKK